MYGWTDSPCVLQDLVPFGAAALLPLNLNHMLLKQGMGTADHLLPLGWFEAWVGSFETQGLIWGLLGLIWGLWGLIWVLWRLSWGIRGLKGWIWGLRGPIWGPRDLIWGLIGLIWSLRGLIWGLSCHRGGQTNWRTIRWTNTHPPVFYRTLSALVLLPKKGDQPTNQLMDRQ